MTAVVLLLLFTACDSTQDVKIVGYEQAKAVASVEAKQTTEDRYYVIVTWDAVENGTRYKVYAQEDGKKSIRSIGNGQNYFTYSTVGDEFRVNTDIDKWSFRLDITYTWVVGKYRFGVTAMDINPNHSASDIVWSEYITIVAP
jgi:fibronectin type 3 domain-containing protein